MATLKCIGRVDSLGDRDQRGSKIGFVLLYHPGREQHTIVLDETAAEELFREIEATLWPGRAEK